MLRAGGYAAISGPQGTREADTFTCTHCQHIVHVQAGQRPEDLGGWCRSCTGLICPACVGKPCVPWEKQMELIESGIARQNLRAIVAGR